MEVEERATDPLSGGLMGNGYQCGMLWGAALAAGAQAYRLFGAGAQSEMLAMIASQRLVTTFDAQNNNINCGDITGIDISSPTMRRVMRYLVKSSVSGSCFGMAARYAKAALNEINAALGEKPIDAPMHPTSCAAMVAQKMGASDVHTTMAAGLAGGIGLSGGACGALGTVLWINGMNSDTKETGMAIYKNSTLLATMDRYLESADYEFECAKIVGRQFESVTDHASYVRDGGCSKIIEALAASK